MLKQQSIPVGSIDTIAIAIDKQKVTNLRIYLTDNSRNIVVSANEIFKAKNRFPTRYKTYIFWKNIGAVKMFQEWLLILMLSRLLKRDPTYSC